jgi:hypothetical protein
MSWERAISTDDDVAREAYTYVLLRVCDVTRELGIAPERLLLSAHASHLRPLGQRLELRPRLVDPRATVAVCVESLCTAAPLAWAEVLRGEAIAAATELGIAPPDFEVEGSAEEIESTPEPAHRRSAPSALVAPR